MNDDLAGASPVDRTVRQREPSTHVAWCRYVTKHDKPTRIVLCDSDAEGAFPVFRHLELSQIATAKTARELELEDLLRSAHAIAERKGADTAWERFAASCKEQGIGSVTARVYKVAPSDG